jgi:hypothetical protein
VRARFAAAAAAFALLGVLGVFWFLRGPSAPEREPAAPVVEVVKLTPPRRSSAQAPAPAEPRITPIVQEPSTDDATPARAIPAPRPLVASPPRAKPEPPRASPSLERRASSSNSEHAGAAAHEPSSEAPGNAALQSVRPPAAERPAMAHGDDPWNPDSFGERR